MCAKEVFEERTSCGQPQHLVQAGDNLPIYTQLHAHF